MGLADEFPELCLRSEMGIYLCEIEYPIAVISSGPPIERCVLEGRSDPDRGGTQLLDVVEL
jgi:hypothetical protein